MRCFIPVFIAIIISYRCAEWVRRSGEHKLLTKPSHKLCENSYICSAHFGPSQFFNKHRKRLCTNAVPNIFSNNSLTDQDMEVWPVYESTVDNYGKQEITSI